MGEWGTNALAALATIGVAGAAYRYFIYPFFSACWAAIKAAPEIATDLRDLPDLIAELRSLIADNLPSRLALLEAEMMRLSAEVVSLRNPVIAGGEGEPEEPFMLSPDDVRHVRDRLRGGSHIPGPEEA